MGNEFLVSIICPLYNKERYIAETIDSVIEQTYSNWELLIIDDGSTDSSSDIVNKYSEKDNRIKFYKRTDFKQNKGASVCRNIGIEESQGYFILFLDADDLLKPNCLADRLSYVKKNQNYDFYVFNMERFLGTIENIVPKKISHYIERIQYTISLDKRKFITRKFLKYSTLWSICNPLWKKESLIKLGGFNEDFQRLQDPEIHTRALLEGLKFNFLKYKTKPDVLVRNDIDRRSSINKKQMYKRIAISLEMYINTIYPILIEKKLNHQVKYLDCYTILIEQITEGYKNTSTKNEEREFYIAEREQFYNSISILLRKEYRVFQNLYRFLSKNSLMRKLRIPAMFVFFYKNIL